MSMRMKTWLWKKHEEMLAAGHKFDDWAWIKKDECWRPLKSYKIIGRGKNKGSYTVTLFWPEGKKRIVLAKDMRFADNG